MAVLYDGSASSILIDLHACPRAYLSWTLYHIHELAMTIAELHGKLSSTGSNAHDRREDLLTSDVFGTLRYLPPRSGIIPFLCLAMEKTAPQSARDLNDMDDEAIAVRYGFWPHGRATGREPDVVIEISTPSGPAFAFTIESKYESGPSDIEREDQEVAPGGRQLGDQFEDLLQPDPYTDMRLQAPIKNRFLVYVTAHLRCPDETLSLARAQLEKRHSSGFIDLSGLSSQIWQSNMLWASWADVWTVMKDLTFSAFPFDIISTDLMKLLERKGFRRFSGMRCCDELVIDGWGYFWSHNFFQDISIPQLPGSGRFFEAPHEEA